MVLAVDSDSDCDVPATQVDAEELAEEDLTEDPAQKPVMTAVKAAPAKKPEPEAAKVALGTAVPALPKSSPELAAMQEQYAALKAQMEMMQRAMGAHLGGTTPEPQKPVFSPVNALEKGVSEASLESSAVKSPAPMPPAGLHAVGTSVAGPPPKTGALQPPPSLAQPPSVPPTPPAVPSHAAPPSAKEQELADRFDLEDEDQHSET